VTLWHGRFAEGPAEALMAYTASIGFDLRLAADDVACSLAHVEGLARAGILEETERAAIAAALGRVATELADGTFAVAPADEDVHTAIERRVTELAGPVGGKLHTGRSRNDQVATALRRWTLREMAGVAARAVDLATVLAERAETAGWGAGGVALPGYTHLQRAQPVLLAHHLAAHAWALLRDVDRALDALARADVSPLGAGALAGTSLPIDPDATARAMGFAGRFDNSLDAVSDRDFVAEALFVLALLGVHLSRIGEEWVLWTSEEFGFATLADAYATGSSMMPQKKNADVAELARGKAGRVIGNLAGLLATLKGLPLAYNRDLQEDKEPLFDSVDQVGRGLVALAGMIATATFRTDRMALAGAADALVATDLAEWLVARGTPFREAHARVGALVGRAAREGARLGDLVAADAELADAAPLFAPGAALARRTSAGGAGPATGAAQSVALARRIEEARVRVAVRLGGRA
jgi:argininosuccinate lyase